MIGEYLKKVLKGEHLTTEEASAAMGSIMAGECASGADRRAGDSPCGKRGRPPTKWPGLSRRCVAMP